MVKVRRGNYVFLTWIGDHSPRHVHVYRRSKLVVKWDLENWRPMEGKASRKLLQLIEEPATAVAAGAKFIDVAILVAEGQVNEASLVR